MGETIRTLPTRRGISIPIRWLVPAILLVILSPILSMIAAVRIADNNAKHLQDQYIADRNRTSQAATVILCGAFNKMIDAYNEIPSSASSEKIQGAWIDLYTISQCQPPRTR